MRQDIKSKAIRRLRIIEGQVRGLQNMIDTEAYCVDIITQTSALKEALSALEDLLMENHLTTHVLHQMRSGKDKQATKEILKVYALAKRKK